MICMSYGLIRKRWFAKLQFRQLHIRPELFDVYYADTCAISRENMIAFLRSNSSYQLKDSLKQCTANVIVAVGGKEAHKMKQSAQRLHQVLPNSELVVFPDYHHGELSINYADDYVTLFRSLLEK